jgi:hypothetical protein
MSDNTQGSLIGSCILLAVWLFATMVGACDVPASKAERVLEGAGYTDIAVGGHAWWSCGGDDSLSSEFTATGPSGKPVAGAVCCGFAMKDCTVRSE